MELIILLYVRGGIESMGQIAYFYFVNLIWCWKLNTGGESYATELRISLTFPRSSTWHINSIGFPVGVFKASGFNSDFQYSYD